jgi:uncharacterized protein GlcG (DUF336 family)
MPRTRFVLMAAVVAMLMAATPLTMFSQEILTTKVMSLDLAHGIAMAALQDCRSHGYHVVVIVMDTNANIRVMLRDDGTGPRTVDTTRRKAYTALTFRGTSREQAKLWETQKNPNITADMVALAGGVAIKAGDELLGAIGVSGAPGSDKDEPCALAGVAKYADKLK